MVTTLSAAVGIVFAANLEHDAGSEIALATATSLRTILLCRFLLVTGFTMLLSGGTSAAVALLSGQGPWGIIQLWLGPLLLISSLTLALALVAGSWISIVVTCLLETAQTLRFGPDGHLFPLPHSLLWQTNPVILALAVWCLVFAFLYAPRQARLYTHADEAW